MSSGNDFELSPQSQEHLTVAQRAYDAWLESMDAYFGEQTQSESESARVRELRAIMTSGSAGGR